MTLTLGSLWTILCLMCWCQCGQFVPVDYAWVVDVHGHGILVLWPWRHDWPWDSCEFWSCDLWPWRPTITLTLGFLWSYSDVSTHGGALTDLGSFLVRFEKPWNNWALKNMLFVMKSCVFLLQCLCIKLDHPVIHLCNICMRIKCATICQILSWRAKKKVPCQEPIRSSP